MNTTGQASKKKTIAARTTTTKRKKANAGAVKGSCNRCCWFVLFLGRLLRRADAILVLLFVLVSRQQSKALFLSLKV